MQNRRNTIKSLSTTVSAAMDTVLLVAVALLASECAQVQAQEAEEGYGCSKVDQAPASEDAGEEEAREPLVDD